MINSETESGIDETCIAWFDEIKTDATALVGGKGVNLGKLTHAGLPVPSGFVVTTDGYDAYITANDMEADIGSLATQPETDDPSAYEEAAEKIQALFSQGSIPERLAEHIHTAYTEISEGGDVPVAVRSSATAEDLPDASFAGQQETFLNIDDVGSLNEAIVGCWASLWTARAMAYRNRQDFDWTDVSLAVIIQRMVPADASGVLFTANPTNGRRDQAVINAAWGLGESVVDGSVTPDTLVVDKDGTTVVSRDTAEKEVMTVRTESGTEERTVPEDRRRQPVLDDDVAAELVHYGKQIEEQYQRPMDIEWAVVDGECTILQARPITSLPEPQTEPPTDWTPSDPEREYFRMSIIELLPDPLSPLFADLGTEAISRETRQMRNDVLGADIFSEETLGFTTINGYGYYCYYPTLRSLGSTLVRTPFTWYNIFPDCEVRWRDEIRPQYAERVTHWEEKPMEDQQARELLSGVKELLHAGVEYYVQIQAILTSVYLSESLFTTYYDRLIKQNEDPLARTFLLGFDNTPIKKEKSLYDLATWSREHPQLKEALAAVSSDDVTTLLETETPPADVSAEIWHEWQSRFQDHLDQYGHTIYNLDFVNPVPADDPAPPYDTFKHYLQGDGANPHERQHNAVEQREQATQQIRENVGWFRQKLFDTLLNWAQNRAPLREDALADVGLAWPRLREMLLELGRRLAEASAIEQADDVFWLTEDEAQNAATALDTDHAQPGDVTDAVRHRKMKHRGRSAVTPPTVLPEDSRMKKLGLEQWLPAHTDEQTGDTITGVGASSGQITAQACVVHGPDEFETMESGDVLVADITTPAWTPLFAQASAIVTDVGGPLSHSSIVAREYDIPAVLGTGVGTESISTGQTISVDGDAGIVELLDRSENQEP
jgi:phosphohistidine swiveling domain-containing protein